MLRTDRPTRLVLRGYNPERRDLFLISDKISEESYGLYTRKGFKGPVLSNIADVAGVAVAAVSGYAIFDELNSADAIAIPWRMIFPG
jgi:hypothetical protein